MAMMPCHSTMPTCQKEHPKPREFYDDLTFTHGFPSIPGFPNGFPQWIDISKLLRGDVFRQTGLARGHHNGRL